MTPAGLARLHALCFTAPPPWSEAAFREALAAPGTFLLTAPEGFLIGRAAAGEAELLTLAVAPGARRQGIGRALVARFAGEAEGRGAERLFLEVAADNFAARALYAGAGFRDAGFRRGYYRRPSGAALDAVLMVREGLAAPLPGN
ncbi:MAG: GNAT family N-acetyltransferase [Paracoccaceae bacterium]